MSNSSLVTKKWPAYSGNFTSGRQGSDIWGIVIHHAASTSLESVGQVFSTPGRMGSAHYGVKGTNIHQYVLEEDGAWHAGDYWANMGTIGIETVNSTGAPNWRVDDATFNTLVKLVADIAKRNNLGKLKFDPDGYCPNLSAHRNWAPTQCPGDYLYSKMNELAEKVNAINYPPTATKPTIKWVDLPEVLGLFTTSGAKLIDLDTNVVKQTYTANTKINLVQKATLGGKVYYRTEYSKSKGFNWAFEESMFSKPAPVPAPEPEPTPTPEPEVPLPPNSDESGSSSQEPAQDKKEQTSTEQSGSLWTTIINILKKIIKFLTQKKGA